MQSFSEQKITASKLIADGKYNEAEALLTKLIETARKNHDNAHLLPFLTNRAETRQRLDQWEGASEDVREIFQLARTCLLQYSENNQLIHWDAKNFITKFYYAWIDRLEQKKEKPLEKIKALYDELDMMLNNTDIVFIDKACFFHAQNQDADNTKKYLEKSNKLLSGIVTKLLETKEYQLPTDPSVTYRIAKKLHQLDMFSGRHQYDLTIQETTLFLNEKWMNAFEEKYYYLAKAYYRLNQFEKALEICQMKKNSKQFSPHFNIIKGIIYAKQDKHEEAHASLLQILLALKQNNVYLTSLDHFIREEQQGYASHHKKEIIAYLTTINNANKIVYAIRTAIMKYMKEETNEALRLLQSVENITDKNVNIMSRLHHYLIALCFLKEGNFKNAKKYFLAARETLADEIDMHQINFILSDTQNKLKAKKALVEDLLEDGESFLKEEKKSSEAIQCFKNAIQNVPHPAFFIGLALAYEKDKSITPAQCTEIFDIARMLTINNNEKEKSVQPSFMPPLLVALYEAQKAFDKKDYQKAILLLNQKVIRELHSPHFDAMIPKKIETLNTTKDAEKREKVEEKEKKSTRSETQDQAKQKISDQVKNKRILNNTKQQIKNLIKAADKLSSNHQNDEAMEIFSKANTLAAQFQLVDQQTQIAEKIREIKTKQETLQKQKLEQQARAIRVEDQAPSEPKKPQKRKKNKSDPAQEKQEEKIEQKISLSTANHSSTFFQTNPDALLQLIHNDITGKAPLPEEVKPLLTHDNIKDYFNPEKLTEAQAASFHQQLHNMIIGASDETRYTVFLKLNEYHILQTLCGTEYCNDDKLSKAIKLKNTNKATDSAYRKQFYEALQFTSTVSNEPMYLIYAYLIAAIAKQEKTSADTNKKIKTIIASNRLFDYANQLSARHQVGGEFIHDLELLVRNKLKTSPLQQESLFTVTKSSVITSQGIQYQVEVISKKP